MEADLGPLQIAYRESILSSATEVSMLERTIGETRHSVTLTMSVHPRAEGQKVNSLKQKALFTIVPGNDSEMMANPLKRHHIRAIDDGIKSAMARGWYLTSDDADELDNEVCICYIACKHIA